MQEWGRRGGYDRENSTDEVKIFKEHENSQLHLFVFVNKVIKPEKVNPYNVISYLRPIWSEELRIFGQRIFSLKPLGKIMSCWCGEQYYARTSNFDPFICSQTMCQNFLETPPPFSNQNELTSSDRLHISFPLHFYLWSIIHRSSTVSKQILKGEKVPTSSGQPI